MLNSESSTGIATLRDALHFVQGGEQFVISVSSQSLADDLLPELLKFASPKGGAMSIGALPDFKQPLRIRFEFAGDGPVSRFSREAKAAVARLGQEQVLLLSCITDLSNDHREELYKALSSIAASKSFRVVWIVREATLGIAALLDLRDKATWFLDLRRTGTAVVAQFLRNGSRLSAQDYLPMSCTFKKDGLHFSTARVVLGEAEGDEATLDFEQMQYKNAFESAADGLIFFEIGRDFKQLNLRAREALGYDEAELQTLSLINFVDPSRRFSVLRSLHALRRKGKHEFVTRIRRKSGRSLDIEVAAVSLGRNTFFALCRDVSSELVVRANAHALEQEYERFITSLPYPFAIFVNRKLTRWNDHFTKLFPWTKDESPSVTEFFGRRNAELLKDISSLLDSDNSSSTLPSRREVVIPGPNKVAVPVEVTFTALQYQGRKGLYCTFVDVAERYAIRQHGEAIEQKFSALFENALEGIAILEGGKISSANRRFAEMFEYRDAMELLGREFGVLVAGRNVRTELIGQLTAVTQENGELLHFAYTGKASSGKRIDVEAQATRITIDGRPAVLTHHRDVSATKQTEAEFARKAKWLDILNRIADDLVQAASLDELYKRGMLAAMKGAQLEAGAMFTADKTKKELQLLLHQGLTDAIVQKLVSQSLDDGFARFFSKTHEPLIVSIAEYPPYLHYKALFEVEGYKLVAFLPVVVDGVFEGVLLLCTKTERPIDEIERSMVGAIGRALGAAVAKFRLAERNHDLSQRLQTTIEQISDVLYTLTPSGTFIEISANVERLIGFKREDFITNAGLWRTLLHPDDRPILSQRISNQSGTLNQFVLEYRILPKGKAAYIWLRDTVRYKRDAAGIVQEINGILSDITAAKQLAEDASAPATSGVAYFESDILGSISTGVAIFDEEFICLEWNNELARLTGSSSSDAVGVSCEDIPVVGEVLAEVLKTLTEVESGTSEEVPVHVHNGSDHTLLITPNVNVSKSGTRRYVLTVLPMRNGGDSIVLKETEEILRSIINTMDDALIITDPSGEIWEVNNGFRTLLGYGRDEVRLLRPPYPWIPESDREQLLRLVDAAEDNPPEAHTMTWLKKDGNELEVELNVQALHDAEGRRAALVHFARNVDERRRLSFALEAKNLQIEVLNTIISFANTTYDFQKIFTLLAAELKKLIEYNMLCIALGNEQHTLIRSYEAAGDGDGVIADEIAAEAFDAAEPVVKEVERSDVRQISIPLRVHEHRLGVFSLTSRLEMTAARTAVEFLQPMADQVAAIIQRIRLFDKVREDGEYIHNLVNSIDSVVYTIDSSYVITEVNTAWREFAIRQGLTAMADEQKIVGQPLRSIIPTEEKWQHYQTVIEDLFARRIESYATDFSLWHDEQEYTYHLVINPMRIGEKVTALVFTYTDVTALNRSEAEIKRRNKALIALNTISSSISKSLELDQVLSVASKEVSETFEAQVVMFFLEDTERHQLVMAHQRGISDEQAISLARLGMQDSMVGRAISEHTTIYVTSGLADDPRLTPAGRAVCRALRLESGAVVPLRSKDDRPGAFVISYNRAHTFAEDEQQLLALIASQIAAAVDNARLYTEIQRQVKTLTTLYELGKGLTGAVDLRSMLQIIYREVSRAIPLDRFYYQAFLPDQKKLSLLNRIVKGVPEFYTAGQKQRSFEEWPNNIYQQVVENGKSYMGNSSEESGDSILAVPIRADEEVLGVISVVSSQLNRYTSVHLRLLESIANLAGVAIGKASLYEDTVKKATEIETRNKDLDDFTYVVSHDLKEPLISIEGYSKIVMKDYGHRLDDEGREYLGSVVQSVNRMKHLIDDLLTLSRLGRVQETYENVDVGMLIDEILHDFQFSLKERNITVQVESPLPVVRYIGTRLSMVFRNLISNAMKFNDKPNPVITIGCRDEETAYVFSVSDNGIGIEQEYYDRIFTIFQRLKRSEEYRGTGAGLTIAKKIVEREGGRIWVESMPGQGSTFSFTVKKTV